MYCVDAVARKESLNKSGYKVSGDTVVMLNIFKFAINRKPNQELRLLFQSKYYL